MEPERDPGQQTYARVVHNACRAPFNCLAMVFWPVAAGIVPGLTADLVERSVTHATTWNGSIHQIALRARSTTLGSNCPHPSRSAAAPRRGLRRDHRRTPRRSPRHGRVWPTPTRCRGRRPRSGTAVPCDGRSRRFRSDASPQADPGRAPRSATTRAMIAPTVRQATCIHWVIADLLAWAGRGRQAHRRRGPTRVRRRPCGHRHEQPLPHSDTTHAAYAPCDSSLRTAGTVGQRQRCAIQGRSARPRVGHKGRRARPPADDPWGGRRWPGGRTPGRGGRTRTSTVSCPM